MTTIHLTSKCDHLKGDWYEWYCQKELSDGTLEEGVVQADGGGHLIAEETYEKIEQ